MTNLFKKLLTTSSYVLLVTGASAQEGKNIVGSNHSSFGLWLFAVIFIVPLLIIIGKLYYEFKMQVKANTVLAKEGQVLKFTRYLKHLDRKQLSQFVKLKDKKDRSVDGNTNTKAAIALIILLNCSSDIFAQVTSSSKPLASQPGIIITIVLLLIPILLAVVFALMKANSAIRKYADISKEKEVGQFTAYVQTLNDPAIEAELLGRNNTADYNLSHTELGGTSLAEDSKGILGNISDKHTAHFTATKKRAITRPILEPDITKLILWYLGCSVFWLVVGTGIGEYLGIKFVAPDTDHISWLSFGRLRPVHTNLVFWGWASLAMIGLGYYVVPMVSNAKIYSIKFGWAGLVCTNIMVIAGSLCLMSGISNGGGEFREYTWPVMAFFAVALILTFINFFLTVAKRTTKEIYISNWFILSAILFTIVVALTAYLPFWQNGIGETIVQGYFMHSGVGMWFTLYVVGLLYYFIPQQLNKPIYAYSLGILAFWTQIIFYTIIGTHHFIFSAIPWWLQTVAIVGSMGMVIPVVAATINFTMTFKGHWNKVANSYTLPFFFVAVVYYFLVSMQGTVEAFKFTNLLWHFTDFTVAHAHAGFYGIITFALWGGIYAIIPRLTGIEPPQHLVGAHFWFAFIGLIFYVVPLSIGATYRGMMWMESKPFIDSVVVMFQFWIWRAIGGSLMFISHVIFAYNFYKMVTKESAPFDVTKAAFNQMELSETPVAAS